MDASKICEQEAELRRLHLQLEALRAERSLVTDRAHRDLIAYWSGPRGEVPPEGAERLAALNDSDSS